ncbi:MAG: type II toxin-antitoxin system VapC family toxin [Deltaproteobacteria bacterium]|nr:type II toxin-antitoxin system VapC family toxin [Deltaproteobacteria bacterium]
MILDSSAIVAVFLKEPSTGRILELIAAADRVAVSAATLVEAGIVLSHRKGRQMQHALELFCKKLNIESVPFTDEHREAALRAWWHFGKSRAPAALNLGDCIAYATAKLAGEQLLCTGDDFPKTDLAVLQP